MPASLFFRMAALLLPALCAACFLPRPLPEAEVLQPEGGRGALLSWSGAPAVRMAPGLLPVAVPAGAPVRRWFLPAHLAGRWQRSLHAFVRAGADGTVERAVVVVAEASRDEVFLAPGNATVSERFALWRPGLGAVLGGAAGPPLPPELRVRAETHTLSPLRRLTLYTLVNAAAPLPLGEGPDHALRALAAESYQVAD
jgi:hypothetical protein